MATVNGAYYPDSINPFVSSPNPFEASPSTSTGYNSNPRSSLLGSSNDEKVFFVAIIRNEETLVKFAQFAGNYEDILSQVLPKIVRTNGIKMTLNYEK
jgi:hypothetical protein